MSLANHCRVVVTATEDEGIVEVARRMRDARVGSVVVVRGAHVVGLLTDRDLVLRVLAEGTRPERVRARDVMTRDPIVVSVHAEPSDAAARMREHGIRRLPIVDDAVHLVGIVTSDDLTYEIARDLADLAEAVDGAAEASESR